MRSLRNIFRKDNDDEGGAAGSLRLRFSSFQALLADNNAVLELMADLEEKRSGEFLFDRAYLGQAIDRIVPAVGRIVERLDHLTGGKYPELARAHAGIAAEIARAFAHRAEVPEGGALVLPLAEVSGGSVLLAGGKMAHLGEVRNGVGLPVPEGFVVTSRAYLRFLEHNRIAERVEAELAGVSPGSLDAVEQASARLQGLVRGAELPPDVATALAAALAALEAEEPGGRYAVRSSAVLEDGELSFAGQYATFLNVPAAEVAARYAEVVASLFSPRAVFYCLTRGFSAGELLMAAGVIRMVDAASAGVAYSLDPNDPDSDALLVSAAPGLGTTVVDGSGAHDTFRVARSTGRVLERRIAVKEHAAAPAPGGGLREAEIPASQRGRPALEDPQLAQLAGALLALERHAGAPQDVEWAFTADGRLTLLQARPLRIPARRPAPAIPRRISAHRTLLDGGEVASRGAGSGPVFLLSDEADLPRVPEGAVLVARTTSTRFVTVMPRLAAIVTDVGGAAGHMASLAREFGVPALLDTGTATRVLAHGQEVTVDAIHGVVYEGRVEQLLASVAARREPLRESPLVRALEEVLRWIAPLNLTDPAAPDFGPASCRTLHDITRFAHEKAMDEMFEAGSGPELAEKGTITLLAGIPVGVHLLDLGGGVRPGVRTAAPEDVLSLPFAAMLRGMRSMRWPDPPPVDAGGFLGMVAHTAAVPEEELARTAERSFAIVSASYMHFSIRLGYHFSLVEAFVGERLNDNYIRFFFKGGGAATERRLRRVRLIREILRRLDFQVRLTEDVIDAALLKFRAPELAERLTVLGKLTAYTKQLDMAMFNDDVTDWYRDEFIRDHVPLPAPLPSPQA
jgi:pyruvate,water dikinase